MSAPQQPRRRENKSVEAVPPQQPLDPVSGPDGDSSDHGDQDIDTAGTEHDEESPAAAEHSARRREDHDTAAPVARPVIDRHR